jgi:hypothetical protein
MAGGREQGKAPKDEPQKTYFCFNTTGMYLFPRDKFDESIKDIIEAPEKYPEIKEEKKFKVVAELFQDGNNTPMEKQMLPLTLSPYEGWTLVKDGKNKGKLMQGRTGWLMDENGLYILQDGRRVDENIIKNGKYSEKELKIGNEDPGKGLKEILGVKENFPETILNEYETKGLLERYGPHMTEVVYQAFQINRGYCLSHIINNSSAWEQCTRYPPYVHSSGKPPYYITAPDCSFGVIGLDETGIPIIVTRVGSEGAKKKIVIAGPHGNERNAQFVVLQSQRHFIQYGLPKNTVLYFIPCISPTLFFADARGLPFVKEENGKYAFSDNFSHSDNTDSSVIRNTINGIYNFLTIPKLHDFMAEKIDGEIVHTKLQSHNGNSISPIYGIDANRDYYNVLKSTQVFGNFINDLRKIPEIITLTVFMLHGYDSEARKRVKGEAERDYPGSDHQGAVYGPYLVDANNKMYLPEDFMRYTDLVTLCLFGYRQTKAGSIYTTERSSNYIFENAKDKYLGEWTKKLYDEFGRIFCFDIELAESYRQGTRGKTGTSGKDKEYVPELVIKRHEKGMPFFQDKTKGKFVDIPERKITFIYPKKEGETKNRREEEITSLSFYNFLTKYYDFLKKAQESEEIK